MAAYAALVSLRCVLEHVLHPTRHWSLLDTEQIQSLDGKVCSLQVFLEKFSHQISKSTELKVLICKMADASYEAEDIIDSFMSGQILGPLPDKVSFSQDIQKVIEEMDRIASEVTKIEEKMVVPLQKDEQRIDSSPAAGLSTRLAPIGKTTTVGLEEGSVRIMGRLTGHDSSLQIVPIVGMGGIGKTTLAKKVFENQYIVEQFGIRAWVTVSQEYNLREVLVALLHGVESSLSDKRTLENIAAFSDKMSKQNDEQLREQLHKSLYGRRYLIVMDDVWSIDAWDELKNFFPNNYQRSRIIITTRLQSDVAMQFGSDFLHQVEFLNEDKSWELFCANVFPQPQVSCPPELEEIGKKIVRNCKGLPLALVVIGGFLANSMLTREYWEEVAENLTSMVTLGNDEQCHKILSLSYSHLPIHLKPCFLHMATFPEDRRISVSKLIKLWVAEGFLKPIEGKSFEEVAAIYLDDLVGRNLVVAHKRGIMGNIKSCTMHDLLRELCLREAARENFLCIASVYSANVPPGIQSTRRLCVHRSTKQRKYLSHVLDALQSASFARSLVCESEWVSPWLVSCLKLLRVLDVVDKHSVEEIMQLVNSRYLALNFKWHDDSKLSSISRLWNLQTLIVPGTSQIILPPEIWKMTQLRHLQVVNFDLPDPPQCHSDVLENLQTLSTVRNFRCTEEVFKRVPNLKKMKITYEDDGTQFSFYCLTNLVHLQELESLSYTIKCSDLISAVGNIAFPNSLKKLTLRYCGLPWEDIEVVGSLPSLEVLNLEGFAFHGPEWNAVEGQFQRLKFLLISYSDLQHWNWSEEGSGDHFPSLQHLVIHNTLLARIPEGLAELAMLELIELSYCKDSVINSARDILVESENQGNEGLKIQVRPRIGKEYYLTKD